MSSDAAVAGYDCAALCAICCTESLLSWCGTKAVGSGRTSSRTAGCCTGCCKRSFDEDAFENEERRIKERAEAERQRQAGNIAQAGGPTTAQPSPQAEMSNGLHAKE